MTVNTFQPGKEYILKYTVDALYALSSNDGHSNIKVCNILEL